MTDHRLGRKGRLSALSTVIAVLGMGADDAVTPVTCLTPEIRAALARISPNSLRGHLSFLSSDLLEGRGTPSRGLDLAAEYIAAEFRRGGLEPAGDQGYFQTADFASVTPNTDGFEFTLEAGGKTFQPDKASIALLNAAAADLHRVPAVIADANALDS